MERSGGDRPMDDDEAFKPSAAAASSVAGSGGDISAAGRLLDDDPGNDAVNPTSETAADVVGSESGDRGEELFTIPVRARADLGDPTLSDEIAELAADEDAPATHEVAKASIMQEVAEGIERWHSYGGAEGLRLPRDTDQLARFMRNFEGTIETLAQIKLDMISLDKDTSTRTNGGRSLGRSLHPVLIPWEFYWQHMDQENLALPLPYLRDKQGMEDHVLNYPSFFDASTFAYFRPGPSRKTVDGAGYLHQRFEEDGWWGIMLAQTGTDAGAGPRQAPEEYTQGGQVNYRVGGYRVDCLGIFEWLALSLQEHPRTFSGSKNLLLANYEQINEGDYVNPKIVKSVPWSAWDEEHGLVEYGWIDPTQQTHAGDFTLRAAIDPRQPKVEPEGED